MPLVSVSVFSRARVWSGERDRVLFISLPIVDFRGDGSLITGPGGSWSIRGKSGVSDACNRSKVLKYLICGVDGAAALGWTYWTLWSISGSWQNDSVILAVLTVRSMMESGAREFSPSFSFSSLDVLSAAFWIENADSGSAHAAWLVPPTRLANHPDFHSGFGSGFSGELERDILAFLHK